MLVLQMYINSSLKVVRFISKLAVFKKFLLWKGVRLNLWTPSGYASETKNPEGFPETPPYASDMCLLVKYSYQ